MLSLVGNTFGVGDPAVDVQAQVLAVAGSHLDHARGQIGDRTPARDAGLDQVEQEEAAAAAQLQGTVVGQLTQFLGRHGGVEQIAGVVHAAFVVGDRPLVVVGLGLPVVIQDLGQLAVLERGLDLFRGGVRIGGGDPGSVVVMQGSLTARARGEDLTVALCLLTSIESTVDQCFGARDGGRRSIDEPAGPGGRGVEDVIGATISSIRPSARASLASANRPLNANSLARAAPTARASRSHPHRRAPIRPGSRWP